MPDIGVPELLIILVIVVILFGADRLTDVMKSLGQGVAEFRKGMREGTPPNEDKSNKV